MLPLRMGLPQWRNEVRNSPMCQLLLDPHRIYWEQVKKGMVVGAASRTVVQRVAWRVKTAQVALRAVGACSSWT